MSLMLPQAIKHRRIYKKFTTGLSLQFNLNEYIYSISKILRVSIDILEKFFV